MAISGCPRNGQGLGRLVQGEASEEMQLNNCGSRRVLFSQLGERFIDSEDRGRIGIAGLRMVLKFYSLALPAMAETAFSAGVFHHDPPPSFGCGGEEMAAAIPLRGIVASNQPHIGLMNESGGLKRMTRPLGCEAL